MDQIEKPVYSTEIPTLEKGLAIVELVASRCESASGGPGSYGSGRAGAFGLSFSGLSSTLGIAKASLARLLRTLTTLGYITKHPETGLYGPGEKVAVINRRSTVRQHLLEHGRVVLQELSRLTDSTAILFYWTGNAFEVIDKEVNETSAAMQDIGNVDTAAASARQPWWWVYLADCDAKHRQRYLQQDRRNVNRTVASYINSVKQRGYACDDGRFHQGLSRFAVPIRDHQNRIVAALAMGVFDNALKQTSFNTIVDLLKQKGTQLSKTLGCPISEAVSHG